MKVGLSGLNVGPFARPELLAQFARQAEQFGFESVDVIEVSQFLADRAVPVQKNGAAQRLRFRHSWHPEQKVYSASF